MKILTLDFNIFVNDYTCENDLSISYDLYHSATMWFVDKIHNLKPDQICFIGTHENIIQCLDINDYYDIINVDRNHDMGYGDQKEQLHCFNWVQYLFDAGMVNSYTWIYNNLSQMDTSLKYPCQKNSITTPYILDKIGDVDKIFICLSGDYLPERMRDLFHLWCSLYVYHYKQHIDII